MNKTTIKKNRLIILSLCFIHLFTACVNKIDSETPLGTVPITFTTKVSKTNTRVTNTAFDFGKHFNEKRMIKEIKWDCTQCCLPLPLQKNDTLTIYC